MEPEKFAAIYARVSSQKENNSINAQIKLGTEKALKEGLLIYNSYSEHVSGLTTSPEERKSFKQLLLDAKAGCFKNLIIYRLDRLVRNYEDWKQTEKLLDSLGIKLIFSDESQQLPSDSPQSEFLNNLTVMLAELEP
ncbi:recombinase family protein [Clostridium perfringens]|nr:recombinase family protein [Clostridium perfringens]